MNTRAHRTLLTWLVLALAALFGAGRASAQQQPSSDVLLPYFEVDLEAGGMTTVFGIGNALNQPVDVRVSVFTNWGISVLSAPVTLPPFAVHTVDLREWLISGKLPNRTLSAEELEHVQAALSGSQSPRDNLYYSASAVPDHMVGYVIVRTLGNRPDALWGDYYVIDSGEDFAQGDTLVNIDSSKGCPGVCKHHLLRFLGGKDFDIGGTQVVIWTGKTGAQPTAGLSAPPSKVAADTLVYNDQGQPVDARKFDVLPVQVVNVKDLGLRPNSGWLDILTDVDVFIGVHHKAKDRYSVALQSYCASELPPGPGIRIRKLTNGDDANTPPGPSIPVGGAVKWEYIVDNIGDLALTKIKVTDDRGVAVKCPKSRLEAGESMTCTGSGTAAACQYSNIGKATAETDQGVDVSAEDISHYFGAQNAALAIETSVNGQDADTAPGPQIPAGSSLQWKYTVTNTGDVKLTYVKVTDSKGIVVSCPKTELRPGESMACTGNGTAATGQQSSVGAASGKSPCGNEVKDDDPAYYHNTPVDPGKIDLEKHTNGHDADNAPGPEIPVGGAVLWEYFVTNTGTVVLNQIKVSDDRGVAVSCPTTTLQPGESMRCTGNGTATEGQYRNVGTVTGMPPSGPNVTDSDPSHYLGKVKETPKIDIEKHTNGQDADTPTGPHINIGSPVLWEYFVTNLGDVALANVKVTDDRGVAVSCPKTTLAVGEQMRCTGNGTAVLGQYKNVGTATGTSPKGTSVTDSDPSHYLGCDPGDPKIDVEKHTNGHDADAPKGPEIEVGKPVLWEYFVTNTGNVALTNVKVSDDRGVIVTCPKTTLAVGEQMRCTGNGTAALGQYKNIGTATGTPPSGPNVTDSDPSHYYGVEKTPKIDIEKHTNGHDADAPQGPEIEVGKPVLWEYFVTNTGDVALANVRVTDDRGVIVTCPKTALAIGEMMRCTGNGTAALGQYKNIGTATGTAPNGSSVTDQDPSHYYGLPKTGNQGCTPGYWKNHEESWPPTGFSTGQKVQSAFGAASGYPSLGNASLHEALSFKGGSDLEGAAGNLLRAAVAGLLNTSHPGVNYPRSTQPLVQDVNAALASQNRDTMLSLAGAIDKDNNLGCPLN